MSDNYTPEGAPAVPAILPGAAGSGRVHHGFTARERAAIDLRVPDSGNPWLDEMIAKSRRLDMLTELTAAAIASSLYEGELNTATNLADVATRGLMAEVLERREEGAAAPVDAPAPGEVAEAEGFKVGDIITPATQLSAEYSRLETGTGYRVARLDSDGWIMVCALDDENFIRFIDGRDAAHHG